MCEVKNQTSQAPNAAEADVLIAGGGPVGLCLANLLGRRGHRVIVAERRTERPDASQAIGITPPSLAVLKELGLHGVFADQGVRIDTARVFENGTALGAIDFSRLPTEHRYILSLPQSKTIDLLRGHLKTLPCVRLLEGFELMGYRLSPAAVCADLRDVRSGKPHTVRAAFLAGCDGHSSATRRQAGLRWRVHRYGPRFMMADFTDNSDLGQEAHLYFGRTGSVESFPLPGGQRRWVVQTDEVPMDGARLVAAVAAIVAERTGIDLASSPSRSQSSFQPWRALVPRYATGRAMLCGDAAHVMSPIGGQGMNTGFADAAHLSRVLDAALGDAECLGRVSAGYTHARRRAFRAAAARAACGMWLGTRRGSISSALRRVFIEHVLMRPFFRDRLALYFSMLTIPHSPGFAHTVPAMEDAHR